MNLPVIESKVKEKLITLGYELVSLSLKTVNGKKTLEIVVDRVEPIDMNAIVELSGIISSYLDEIDTSDEPYVLDVSSLGAEKPLKVENLKDYVSSYVCVHLINPMNGENIFNGTIKEVNEDSFTLSYFIKGRAKELNILLSNIYKIRLAIK